MALEWQEGDYPRRLFRRGYEEEEINIDPDGLPLLLENVSYIIEGNGIESAGPPFNLIRHSDEAGPAVGELRFANTLGVANVFGRPFRITSSKVTDKQFKQMLADVSTAICNLPFDFNTPTSLPYSREKGHGQEVLYQRFAYLRHITLSQEPCLEELFGSIESNPHRIMMRERYFDDVSRARSVGPSTIIEILRRTENLVQIGAEAIAFEFPISMSVPGDTAHKLVPSMVLTERVDVTLDNPENRFIKHFLSNCLQTCESMAEAVRRSNQGGLLEKHLDLIGEIADVRTALERMAKSQFLLDVGDLVRIPSNSQVLQRKYGYRQFFVHHHRMERAADFPMDANSVKRIIESKDVATLYEYWCFFVVADELEKLFGPAANAVRVSPDDFKLGLGWGISLQFPGEVTLSFNRTYSAPTADGSYSVRLRPDIVLRANDRLHLMDAKFKYNDKTVPVAVGSLDTGSEFEDIEIEENATQVFKLGDLYKMHTYRDAIKGADDVWIIYPGTHFCFYEEGKGRDDCVDEVEELTGVGAVPLKPSGERSCLEQILAKMVGTG